MTGLPTLAVKLDDGTGTFPYDVTAFVHWPTGWNLTRGRGDEFSTVQPSVLRVRFDNHDGRFTLGSPTYGCHIDQMIRFTEAVGATVSDRVTGHVQDWPVEWPNPMASFAIAQVTAVDRLSRLARRKLKTTIANEIGLTSPHAYYPLAEPVDSASAGDSSGNGRPVLVPSGPVVFGTEMVGLSYTGVSLSGAAELTAAVSIPAGSSTMSAIFQGASVPSALSAFAAVGSTLGGSGNRALRLTATGTVSAHFDGYGATGSVVVTDGSPHHIAATHNGTDLVLYVDGVLDKTSNVPFGHSPAPLLMLLSPDSVAIALAQFTFDDTAWSAATVLSVAEAALGISSDTSDERITRLAAYANIDPADLALEAGVLTDVPAQETNGVSVDAAMAAVVTAEGGVLFIDGSGDLVLHNRTHRVIAATGTPALALVTSDVDPDLLITADKQYLFNTVTGSRDGGATQTVTNAASLLAYEEYPDDMSGLLVTTDAEVLDAITWRAGAYSEPVPRLSTVTIDMLTSPTAIQQAVLGLELGDRITVGPLPTHSPVATADLIIEGIGEAQSERAWTVTFNTAPASLFRAWILGDATYGALDSTTRLHH